MGNIKKEDSIYYISPDNFEVCLIDNTPIEKITKIITLKDFQKKSAYKLEKFEKYLERLHNISLREYCEKYLNIEWPKRDDGRDAGYRISGKGICFGKLQGQVTKENNPKFAEHCERMAKERRGEGNPMHGKEPWNMGLDLRDPRVEAAAEKRRGRETPLEVRKRQSEAAKRREIHGHTGHKHKPETIELFRRQTAQKWATGVFSRRTGIEEKVDKFLESLNLNEEYSEQYQVKYFSMDFAFPESKIAIECQGTFFHVDPRVYPDGPICAIQRRNWGRDKYKRKICVHEGDWKIIELWETEINDGTFKEHLKCKLKEYNLLNH